jgi:hypothetical protein
MLLTENAGCVTSFMAFITSDHPQIGAQPIRTHASIQPAACFSPLAAHRGHEREAADPDYNA